MARKLDVALAALRDLTELALMEYPEAEYRIARQFKLSPKQVTELMRMYDAADRSVR